MDLGSSRGMVAYLGPEGTFSHDFANARHRQYLAVPKDTIEEAVNSLASQEVALTVMPLFNSHHLGVDQAFRSIYSNQGNVFIKALDDFEIKCHAYSYTKIIKEIDELWSKEPVFKQISSWISEKIGSPKHKNFESTAAAVHELAKTKQEKVAAIGGSSLAGLYHVPMLDSEIQNKHNFTFFATLIHNYADANDLNQLIFIHKGVAPSLGSDMAHYLLNNGNYLNISSVYETINPSYPNEPLTIFDLNLSSSELFESNDSLESIISGIQGSFQNLYFFGGYTGNSFARRVSNLQTKGIPT